MSEEVSVKELQGIVRLYAEARAEKKAQEEIISEIQARIDSLEGKIIVTLMENNMSNFKIDGVGMASIRTYEGIPSIKSVEEKKQLFDYILRKYGEEVVYTKFSVNPKTLEAFYKEERAALPAVEQELFRLPGCAAPTISHGLAFKVDKGE